ncbi:OmpA family protein [Thermospira aquatica]|uniref:OmpA family protein n=1 Tax=Thermospira aquatica TaxID=2828656 RepID=A0AAX3BCQ3_9SPIR|nr:OmpA family protein [Thermospira aquatica]URA09941.1 OmpA family protein [Thermospira aquatica]
MKRIMIGIVFFTCLFAYGEEFRFNQTVGTKYRFKNFVKQAVYVNDKLTANLEQLHKAVIEVLSNDGTWGYCRGKYEYYLKDVDRYEAFQLKNVYDSRFQRDSYGRMIVPPHVVMPVVRGVPTFPQTNLEVGMSWVAPGEEAQELVEGKLYRIPFEARYVYLGKEMVDNVEYSIFQAMYQVRFYPMGDRYIRSYTGMTTIKLYWDPVAQGIRYYTEEYNFMIVLINGESQSFVGTSEGLVDFLQEEGVKTNLVSDLNQAVKTNEVLSLREDIDGVVVNLGNVLFEFDKATIRKEFEKGLDQLAEVLKKYPKLDIVVSGHTDSIGNPAYNQKLSELRAKAIADYLLQQGISQDRISYIGYGDTRPLVSNATPEGRAKNRRVEIKIITRE